MMADTNCINPAKGREGGDTWEKRLAFLEQLENKHKGDLY